MTSRQRGRAAQLDKGERVRKPRAQSVARHATVLCLLSIFVALAFGPGLRGAFIHDDSAQIVENPWLQSPHLDLRLLTSDVWGYKAEKGEGWSDYWRPVFSLWLYLNSRLFGLNETGGWHAANILLHILVGAIAYGLLLSLQIPRAVSAVIAILFSVHPSQVESVIWISGSPNMLSAAPLLAALWTIVSDARRPKHWKRMLAPGLFALTRSDNRRSTARRCRQG